MSRPERLELSGFREFLVALKPKLFVIDEAHCVSQWGYDFRPSYLGLQQIVSALRPCPVLALTATATPATRGDIVKSLNLDHPLLFVAPFDRPNLSFEVHAVQGRRQTAPLAPASERAEPGKVRRSSTSDGGRMPMKSPARSPVMGWAPFPIMPE